MDNKKGKRLNKELKTKVYSLRLTQRQKDVLKKNTWIKKELDKIVVDYINLYI